MAGLASLVLSIGADTANLVKQVDVIRGKIDSFEGMAAKAGGALAGMFTIGAATAAIKQVIDYGGAITDMSARVGLGVRATQELDYAAKQNGTTIDSVGKVIEKLGVNLAGGNKSAVAGIAALGLSLSDLRAQSPDKQFEMVAEKLRGIEDPAARAKIAFDVMGKGAADVMPLIVNGVGEARDAARSLGVVLDEETVAALDDAGDAMDTVKTAALVLVGKAIGPMLPALTSLAGMLSGALSGALTAVRGGFDWLIQGIVSGIARVYDFAASAGEVARVFPGLADKLGITADAVGSLRAKALEWRDTAAGMALATNGVGAAAASASAKIKPLNVDFGAAEEAEKKAAKAAADHAKEVLKFREAVKPVGFELQSISMGGGAFWIATNYEMKAAVKSTAEEIRALGGDIGDLPADLDFAMRSLEPFKAGLNATNLAAADVRETLGESLTGVLHSIPATIAGAFTGGGGIMGAVKAIATQIGSTVGGSIGFSIGGPMGEKVGAAIGSMAGVVVGGLKKLFGIGVNEAVKVANGEIQKLQSGLVAEWGSIRNLEAAANALGVSFEGAWGHQGQAGLAAFKQLTDDFREALEAVNGEFAPLLQSAIDLGIGLPEGLSRSIEHLIEIGVLTGDTAALFEGLTASGSVNWEKMQTAAESYGIGLSNLGPAFQGARLHDSALQIINDFQMLTAGGADVGGVLSGMSDEIGALVSDSIKFGTEIPANMKPWIEELIRAGLLTDANGVKIDSLGDIKFGAEVASEFDKVISKLQELIDRLPGVISAMQIPAVRVPVVYDDPGFNPRGGERHENGTEYPGFAVGTAGRFLNFGAGTNVTLHGRERVVTEAEGRAEARAAEGQGFDQLALEDALAEQTRKIVRGMREAIQFATA